MDVITYPCWDYSYTTLVKGVTEDGCQNIYDYKNFITKIFPLQSAPTLANGLAMVFAKTSGASHMVGKVWGEITLSFPNFNGCTFEVWEWISDS